MKKFIMCAIALIMLAVGANAQQILTPALDTNTNTETRNIVTGTNTKDFKYVAVQYVGTKVSGTISGKVYLESSVDGTNYGTAIDSLTLTDQATNTKIFDVSLKPRKSYRFRVVTSGTMKLKNQGYLIGQL